MIVDAAPPHYGGAGRQALLLATRLTKLGHDVRIVARRKEPAPSNSPFVRYLGPHLRSQTLSSVVFATLCFFRVLFSRADVIHCHGAFYYGYTTALASRIRGIPFVLKVTLVGSDDPQSVAELSFAGLPIGRVIVRQFGLADVVIALNREVAGRLERSGYGSKVRIIPNGIEIDLGQRQIDLDARAGRDSRSSRVIFTGEACVRKGVDSLLEAWPSVLAADPNASLTLVGPIDQEIGVQISGIAPEIRHSIITAGFREHSCVLDLLDCSDVFVLASRAEGLPNSLIEAMGRGLPCVASDIPVNVEVGGADIVYCDPDEPSTIAAAILLALEDRLTFAGRALDRAVLFDVNNVVSIYETLYGELILTTGGQGHADE
ncbi:glycosyltransferase family 4 protein [Rhodococcus jostii]